MNKNGLLYDSNISKERLEDLRKGDGKNSLTFNELSKGIEKITGVVISDSQLCKYENYKKDVQMNINNLLAISKYYGVSMEYILGLTETKSSDTTDQYISDNFGLSDKSIKRLKSFQKENRVNKSFINLILENDTFWNEFPKIFNKFCEISSKKDTLEFDQDGYAFCKFSLNQFFGSFLDDLYEKHKIKLRKLFEIKKKERKKND